MKSLLTLTLFCALALTSLHFAKDQSAAKADEPSVEIQEVEIWIGHSLEEDWGVTLPAPLVDHYLRVVEIYPFTVSEMGITFSGCFVEVEDVLWDGRNYIPRKDSGELYVLDLDGVFKPMNEIAVDISDCSAPVVADPNEPA